MKQKLLSLRLVLQLSAVAFVFSSCTNSVEVVNDPDPVGYYKLDVKTTFTNKFTATGLKNGHIAYMRLNGSKWCVDKEVGEDYSFWIKDVRTTDIGDSTVLSFNLELRTPAMVTDGNLIAARNGYRIAYPNSIDLNVDGPADAVKVAAYVKSALERNVKLGKGAAAFASTITGHAEIKQIVEFLLNTFATEAKMKRSQVEGAIVGAISFAEMRDMVKVTLEQ
jgi:hypothetical protein